MTAISASAARRSVPNPTRKAGTPQRREGVGSPARPNDPFDVAMTALLHDAAELRESRDRDLLAEEAVRNEREMAALHGLIRTRARPTAKHYTQRAVMRRAPRPVEAIR